MKIAWNYVLPNCVHGLFATLTPKILYLEAWTLFLWNLCYKNSRFVKKKERKLHIRGLKCATFVFKDA